MNLLILKDEQFLTESSARVNERQNKHIRSILQLKDGDKIAVGRLNGKIGHAIVQEQSNSIRLVDILADKAPPPLLPITLILALPRPQMLKRILQTVACMGVKRLCFIQSGRVEKSFWQSPSATDHAIEEQLMLGLEQGVATQLPIVSKHLRFIPFVEDELFSLSENSNKYIAHPGETAGPAIHSLNQELSLAVGPEGGFLEKEVTKFKNCGFEGIHLGQRILKVETAVPVLLAKLYEV
ncbi:MAG: 16S rRNA (uracil(1498)-N(3))-methyltransferase [Agarilytica sp.]